MSITEACAWSALRCTLIALVCLPVCRILASELRSRSVTGNLLLVAVALPFFVPDLVVGYVYANTGLSLVAYPWLNAALYAALSAFKVLPAGVVAVYVAPPPPTSAEAAHCGRLSRAIPAISKLRAGDIVALWLSCHGRVLLPAFALMFLIAFQEFEIARLMQVTVRSESWPTSWTVNLYEAHAGGLDLSASLKTAIVPTLILLAVLVPTALLTLRMDFDLDGETFVGPGSGPGMRHLSLTIVVAGVLTICAVPVWTLVTDAFSGLSVIVSSVTQMRGIVVDTLSTVGLALCSAITAWLIAQRVVPAGADEHSRRRGGPAGIVVLCTPGLIGSLVLSLVVLRLFQLPGLNRLYDTLAPPFVAVTLFLLPRAVLCRVALASIDRRAGIHVAHVLRAGGTPNQKRSASTLDWQLRTGRELSVVLLLAWFGYWCLTPLAILGPGHISFLPVRLYNLMHYGRSEALTAMCALAVLLPVILAFAVYYGYRLLSLRKSA